MVVDGMFITFPANLRSDQTGGPPGGIQVFIRISHLFNDTK